MSFSYSLEDSTGVIVAHKPNCPDVRALADKGFPVITMLDCAKALPFDSPVVLAHSCLEEKT